ncbi:MAG: site-specific DNA-methyltransferase [Candidatus Rickettsiella isopodorum]|nr:site-specific DNA-methyltransferase [Candidatus Rickettsiella isopodorum]
MKELEEIVSKINIKPYFQEEAGVIYNCDCLELLKQISDKSIDLVLTDPPYNLNKNFENDNLSEKEYIKFFSPIFNEMARIIKLKHSVIIFFDNGKKLPLFWKCLFNSNLIFQKGGTFYKPNDCSMPHNRILRKSEVFYICSSTPELHHDGESFMHDTLMANYGKMDYAGNHPTAKNITIIKKLIHSHSLNTDIILDPLAGSFTTAVAAKELRRKYICCEISEKYCAIGKERLRQEILVL